MALAAAAAVCLCGNTVSASELSFEERVQAHRAIEQVYWNHRIWPEQNQRAKPSLGEVLPAAATRAKVREYLRLSDAARKAERPVTHRQLLDEMDRMVRGSMAPDVLRELFAALGNDSFLIAETLVRQKLVERIDAALPAQGTGGVPTSTAREPEVPFIADSGRSSVSLAASSAPGSDTSGPSATLDLGGAVEAWNPTSTGPGTPTGRREHIAVWTGTEMTVWGGLQPGSVHPASGGRYDPLDDSRVPTTSAAAPGARTNRTAISTGTRMIVWGGVGRLGPLNTGSRYCPGCDDLNP